MASLLSDLQIEHGLKKNKNSSPVYLNDFFYPANSLKPENYEYASCSSTPNICMTNIYPPLPCFC